MLLQNGSALHKHLHRNNTWTLHPHSDSYTAIRMFITMPCTCPNSYHYMGIQKWMESLLDFLFKISFVCSWDPSMALMLSSTGFGILEAMGHSQPHFSAWKLKDTTNICSCFLQNDSVTSPLEQYYSWISKYLKCHPQRLPFNQHQSLVWILLFTQKI